ncbi:RNA polymerase sigma factor [Reichenbachiella sp. MALMAid0571]|uniref:RNA polymerase sigma factor n=1 Tax=Reichenbachiella sp. MALMAid0571 TaxID=3143939 RepID=UPI0032DFBFEC
MNTQNQQTLTDELLVSNLQNGDNSAMGELYSRYYMLVFAKCLSFAKNTDDANDLTQDVMLRVMEKISTFKGDSKFSTWLYAVTFNYCTDKKRKAKGKFFEPIDSLVNLADCTDQERELDAKIKEEVAGKALMTISHEDQQLLIMKYQLNKSIVELQDIYNLSASAVKMRLMRAREKAVTLYSSYCVGVA